LVVDLWIGQFGFANCDVPGLPGTPSRRVLSRLVVDAWIGQFGFANCIVPGLPGTQRLNASLKKPTRSADFLT
jgi:hypothetical protein